MRLKFSLVAMLSTFLYSPLVLAEQVGGSTYVVGELLRLSLPFIIPAIIALGVFLKLARLGDESGGFLKEGSPEKIIQAGVMVLICAVGLYALIMALMV